MAAKLGVDPLETDYALSAQDLSDALIARAKEGGKTEKEISAALAE
jgi:hypothetical protein